MGKLNGKKSKKRPAAEPETKAPSTGTKAPASAGGKRGGWAERVAASLRKRKKRPARTDEVIGDPEPVDPPNESDPELEEGAEPIEIGTRGRKRTTNELANEALAFIEDEEPEDKVTVVMEQRKGLPVLEETDKQFDLSRLKKRLKVIPEFQCSTCSIGPECPEFKEGYVCAFNKAFTSFESRSVDDVLGLMKHIVNKNTERMLRGMLSEEIVEGGQLNMNVTRQSDVVMSQARALLELQRDVNRVTVTVTGPGEQKQGILSKLFGAAKPAAPQIGTQVVTNELPLNPPPVVAGEVIPQEVVRLEKNEGTGEITIQPEKVTEGGDEDGTRNA